MRYLVTLLIGLVLSASPLSAQGDSIRHVSIGLAMSDHSGMRSDGVIGVDLSFESTMWRAGASLGFDNEEIIPHPTDYGGTSYCEWSLHLLRKLSTTSLVANVGIESGSFRNSWGGGLSVERHRPESALFIAPVLEIGITGSAVGAGLDYHRHISVYHPADVVGAWIRYRIEL